MRSLFPSIGSRLSPIGVDLGARVIKAVQVLTSRSTGRGTVTAALAIPRAEPDAPFGPADVDRLAQVLGRRGFKGRDVVLAAPAARLESDMIEMPARGSGAPVDELAAAEIGRGAKLDPGGYEAACWDVPVARAGGAAGTSVLAVALRHADAEALVTPFDAAGYRVTAIDVAGCALARICDLGAAPEGSDSGTDAPLRAILDLGWQAGVVTLVCGRAVLYHRVLYDCGVGPLYRQLADRHEVGQDAVDMLLCGDGGASSARTELSPVARSLVESYAGQVADELSASLAFARHRYAGRAVSAIKIVGGGAKVRGVAEALSAAVRLPVSPPSAPGGLTLTPGGGDGTGWAQLALAAGLALHVGGAS